MTRPWRQAANSSRNAVLWILGTVAERNARCVPGKVRHGSEVSADASSQEQVPFRAFDQWKLLRGLPRTPCAGRNRSCSATEPPAHWGRAEWRSRSGGARRRCTGSTGVRCHRGSESPRAPGAMAATRRPPGLSVRRIYIGSLVGDLTHLRTIPVLGYLPC